VIKKPRRRGCHSPRWAAEPEKIINNNYIAMLWKFVVVVEDYNDANTRLVRKFLFYYGSEQNLISSHFSSLISRDTKPTYEIKQKIVTAKAASNKKIFTNKLSLI
jgi:hypothetical protein